VKTGTSSGVITNIAKEEISKLMEKDVAVIWGVTNNTGKIFQMMVLNTKNSSHTYCHYKCSLLA
jgi:hypothetical protein